MATSPDASADDSRQLREYLDWLCRRYLEITEVSALSGDLVHRLRLEVPAVFVPQRVRAELPPVSLPREAWLRFLARGRVAEHDVPPDLDAELLGRDLREYAGRRSRSVLEVVAETPRVVLLGNPGAGKSMLARYLALTLANPAAWPPPAALARLVSARYVPFVAELRAYPEHAERGPFLDVIDVIAGNGCPVSARSALETCLSGRGNALVIFDGLDEVFDLSLRRYLKGAIREFARLSDGLRVVVTSRVSDYDRHELDAGEFAHFTVDDLSPTEVAAFADRFYQALEPSKARAKRLTTRLVTAVQPDRFPAIAELAGNPLLLTALAFLARGGELPPTRIDALERITDLLAEAWDNARDLTVTLDSRTLTRVPKRDKLELLRQAARRIIERADSHGPRNYLSGGELTTAIAGYLRERWYLSPGDADDAAERLLGQLGNRDFILAKFQSDAYGFVHRAFLDYLAAEDIFWKFSRRQLNEDDIVALFRDRWREPAWREVLPLLAGLLEPEDVTPHILALLRSDPLWYLSPEPLPHHVLLGVRCLGEVRYPGKFREVSRVIAAALISVLELACEPGDYHVGVPIARAIERDVLPVLADLPPDWAGRALYENWYLARGQFLVGTRPGEAQDVAARIYVALLGGDEGAQQKLRALTRWADSPTVRAAAAEAVAVNWPEDTETESLLHSAAADDQEDWHVRNRALRVLARYWHDDARTCRLLATRARTDTAPEVRATAVQVLAVGWHDEDTRALLRDVACGAGEDDPGVRAAAVRGLAEGWRDSQGILPWLWERTADGEPARVRVAAAQALAAHWRDAPATLPWLRKHADTAIEKQAEVRLAAVRALASCWPERQDTRELLEVKIRAARADGEVSQVRCAAVEALAAGWRDERTAQLLRWAVKDPDGEIRYTATQALAAYWAGDDETREVLERLVFTGTDHSPEDSGPYVLTAAAAAVARALPGSFGVAARLRYLAEHDERWYVRRAMLRLVATHWRAEAATADLLKRRAATDPVPAVRCAAVQLVADGWCDDPETLSWLYGVGSGQVAAPADARSARKNAEVCRVAVRAVASGWPGEDDTYSLLFKHAADDDHPEVRVAALQLLAANPRWRESPEAMALLRQAALTARAKEVRRIAIGIMAAVQPGDEQTGDWLREHAFPSNRPTAKLAVISALSAGWHADSQAGDWLRERAATDPELEVCQAAIRALRHGWPGYRGDRR